MWGLFSDAETGEDGAEDFVGGDLASDGAEVVEGVAEVDDHEVGGQSGGEAFGNMQQGLVYVAEGFVVPHVGEHHIGSMCQIGAGCLVEGFGEGVKP